MRNCLHWTEAVEKRSIDNDRHFSTPPAKRRHLDLQLRHKPLWAGRPKIRTPGSIRKQKASNTILSVLLKMRRHPLAKNKRLEVPQHTNCAYRLDRQEPD